MKEKFTKVNIQEIIQMVGGLDIRTAQKLTGQIINAMAAALALGNMIELRGFGSLEVRERKTRTARNPRTGEAVIVPSRRRVIFRPGQELKTVLRGFAMCGICLRPILGVPELFRFALH